MCSYHSKKIILSRNNGLMSDVRGVFSENGYPLEDICSLHD